MESLKTQTQAIATEPMVKLCAEQQERELSKKRGPMREYKESNTDTDILRYFDKELTPKIKHDALLQNRTINKPRTYGPRELDIGTIASPKDTITIFIPLTPRLSHPSDPYKLPKVMYQPDRDNKATREPMSWLIGTPVQISGNSRIVVEEGPICFEMLQYDWLPADDPDDPEGDDPEGKGQNSAGEC
ncbi:hypothetical protein B0T10DRAFT_410847 [Thelonectria olida]|uniref:Uncharacterized protein n=1 Tax=Thelonectria olida TaxID=1576542 RepID=A0A9P8VX48_9HYPO|nr:hypothetical protein B0T10DRAFT_410847 [Thelonectria olida]